MPTAPRQLPDHASEEDHRALAIDKVGIKELSYPIQVLDPHNVVQHTVALVNLYVSLPQEFKGTHMSRFIEVLNRRRGELTIRTMPEVLTEIQERLGADDAHIELAFPYFISKRAPVSQVESLMEYRCTFHASKRGAHVDFVLGVQVPVKSLCPCSKSISQYGAHNQRSYINVRIRVGDISEFVWIEDVVAAVEGCASSPLYALLKREDEKYVTEKAYENPKFVEDLVRDVLLAIKAMPGVQWLHVAAENRESIHNHSAYAEIEWSREDELVGHPPERPITSPNGPAEHEPVSFGEWLRLARQGRGFNQQQLAAHLGISAAHLSRVESGANRLSEEALVRGAALLGQDSDLMLLRAGIVPADLLAEIVRRPAEFRQWADTKVAACT